MNVPNRLSNVLEFVTSVQMGGFTAAGVKLGLTGSAVGKSVSRLEARLGTKLLHRTTRRLTLTNEGALYLSTCLRLIDELEITEQQLATGNNIPSGHVKLDLPGPFGRRHILPILNGISLRHRLLSMSVIFSERHSDVIHEGIDLAIRIGQLPDDSTLIASRIGSQKLVICASPSYLEKNGTPVNPEELLTRECIVALRKDGQYHWLLQDKFNQSLCHPVNARFEMSDGEAMVGTAVAGCGLCQLPTWLIGEELSSGKLCTVMDNYAGAEMPIHAVWPKTPFSKPKVQVLVDEIKKEAKNNRLIFGR